MLIICFAMCYAPSQVLVSESNVNPVALKLFSTSLFITILAGEPSIIAGGLKVALLSTLFGLFTYSISKLSILTLRIIQK